MDKKLAAVQEAQEAREKPGELRLIRRRSSIVPRTNSDPLEFNDDSVERGRARHETPGTSPAISSTSRRSLNLGSVTQFTSPQIAAGIAECIKLNTENKITKKNAFSLKMIDFMTYMVKNRDANMSNLQVASTTLDVSAKIYGLRVDVLHQETMDIVGNLDHEGQNERADGDDNVEDNSGDTSQYNNHTKAKIRKKKRAIQVLGDVQSLCCDADMIQLEPPMLGDGDYQTSDMLLQVTAPRHIGLGLAIHPYNDYILDQRNPEAEEPNEIIPGNPIEVVEDTDAGVIFKDFEFLNWDSEYDPRNSIENWSQHNSSTGEAQYDLNASVLDDDYDNNEFHQDGFTDHAGMDIDGEEALAPAACAHRQQEFIVNDRDMIDLAPTANDYSFFEDKTVVDIRWKSGSQWTVKNPPKNMNGLLEGLRREPVRKKKDFSVDFNSIVDEAVEGKFTQMKKVKRKFTSQELKITRPQESAIERWELFKFGLRPDDEDLMPKKRVADPNERRASGERQAPTAEDFHDFNNSINEDDHVGHDDSIDDMLNDAPPSQNDDHDEFATQSGFIGSNLVEAPKLTEKIYIPFSQRAKKLDMRHLKKCIWNSIIMTTDDKENVDEEETNSGVKETNHEPKPFADIYIHLPEKLNKNDAKELSFPIAFVSLLHLANEKKLKLMSNDEYSDIIVMQEA